MRVETYRLHRGRTLQASTDLAERCSIQLQSLLIRLTTHSVMEEARVCEPWCRKITTLHAILQRMSKVCKAAL